MFRSFSPLYYSPEQLLRHPKLGASFEGFALEQIIRIFDKRSEDCYYWGIHQEGELDLFIRHKGLKLGFEFKFSDAPTLTSSMNKAIEYLKLDELFIIYPGKKRYHLAKKITAIPIKDIQIFSSLDEKFIKQYRLNYLYS